MTGKAGFLFFSTSFRWQTDKNWTVVLPNCPEKKYPADHLISHLLESGGVWQEENQSKTPKNQDKQWFHNSYLIMAENTNKSTVYERDFDERLPAIKI